MRFKGQIPGEATRGLSVISAEVLTTVYNCARIKLTGPRTGCKLWSMRIIMHTGGSHDQEQDREHDT